MSDELIDCLYREFKPDRNTPVPAPPEIMTRCSSPPGSAAGLLDSEEVARKSVFGLEVGTQVWLLDLQALGVSVVDQVGCLHGQGDRVELDPGVVVELALVGPAGDGVDRYGDPRAEGIFDVSWVTEVSATSSCSHARLPPPRWGSPGAQRPLWGARCTGDLLCRPVRGERQPPGPALPYVSFTDRYACALRVDLM